jgi:hypothetical protein
LVKKFAAILLADVPGNGPHHLMMIGAHSGGGLGQTRQVFLNRTGRINALQRGQGTDPDISIVPLHIVQIGNALYIDYNRGTLDPMFHINQKIGSTCKDPGGRLVLQNGHRLIDILWLEVLKFW